MKVTTELTKLYYSIGEVAEMFGVSTSLIRYWESEFTFLRPKKNRKGDRQFTKKDIAYLERIYSLVKERGFTLDGAKRELKKKPVSAKKTASKSDISHRQKEIKVKLELLKKNLINLRDKI